MQTIPIESFLAICTDSTTGCVMEWIGKPVDIEFPVENAKNKSPDESYPFPPTLESPTVARFARRSH